MKGFVLELIEKKKKRYLEDYGEMLGDYNRELETAKGYNGRQLLELLQNCDDEGAKRVQFLLDRDKKTITISNDGATAFSKKGYRSLFIANLSSKTSKRKYIGNKGLGFRSIINWSNAIEIQSNNMSLLYSKGNLKATYDALFPEEMRRQIREEEGLTAETVPMPFLSMPRLVEMEQTNFKTSIIIHYKDGAYKDIVKQVDKITQETLLFLNHIETVEFKGFDNDRRITCQRTLHDIKDFEPSEEIVFEADNWSIFKEEQELPEEYQDKAKQEHEFYQIKLAVSSEFKSSDSMLYSFFPTNIKLGQPYILHATFDLDSTRNQLVDSDKNRYILNQVVEFTLKVAKYYTKNEVSYKPLQILNHTHRADTLDNLEYYDLIDDLIKSEPVFPCIDETYKSLDDIIFVSNDFAEMLIDVKAQFVIENHLKPCPQSIYEELELDDYYFDLLQEIEDLEQYLNIISKLDLSIAQRANFISQIVKEAGFIKRRNENALNFLIDENGDLIKGEEYIYTPVTSNNELKTPEYASIKFINKALFDALIEALNFAEDDNPNKSRFIYDKLKGFTNIHSYEPATLAMKIIRETNSEIEKYPSNAVNIIKEMNRCLYYNFKRLNEDTIIPDKMVKIPTITLIGDIANTEDLVLSEYYPSGKKTKLIFDKVYRQNKYVASPTQLGFSDDESLEDIEDYLKWIKINTFVRYIFNENVKEGIEQYIGFVQRWSERGTWSKYNVDYLDIAEFSKILSKISLEHFVLWVFYDNKLKQQLYDHSNTDKYSYFYFSNYPLYTKPSYLKYQILLKSPIKFSEILIDEKYGWVNDVTVNYKYLMDIEPNITKTAINEILVTLGATEDFNDLPIDKVVDIINKLPEKYPNGSKSQRFYKKALNHYEVNEIEITEQLKLFADNGDGYSIYQQEDIYFSEKIKLPNKLKKDFPIFNFPARAGGEKAIKFFGINDLKNLSIAVSDKTTLVSVTNRFQNHLEELKPYLLTQRLVQLEDESTKKAQASICKSIEIELCEHIAYSVKDKHYIVSDYEFINVEKQKYLIKVRSFDTLESLKSNRAFSNSFADIISLAFDVSTNRSDFVELIRSDREDLKEGLKRDYYLDFYTEARELLGLADYKQAFWYAVFISKGIDYDLNLDDLALEAKIKKEFEIEFNSNSLDYERINSKPELLKIEVLFSALSLSLEEFANNYSYKVSMKQVHFNSIRNALLGKSALIKSSLWKMLEHADIREQMRYLEKIQLYENYHEYVNEIAEQNKFHFTIDTEKIVRDYCLRIYQEFEFHDVLNVNQLFEKNLESFSESEADIIIQDLQLKSMCFFESALNFISKKLKDIQDSENEVLEEDSNLNNDNLKQVKLMDSATLNPVTRKPRKKGKSKVYLPSFNEKALKEKGNSSEKVVLDYLNENGYKNVDPVAMFNEGLHYDIRYTDDNGEIRYVEVKSFDNGQFTLTKSEYDFGKENQIKYEIWLVKDQHIVIPIFDFFTNPKFKTVINEYAVYLENELKI